MKGFLGRNDQKMEEFLDENLKIALKLWMEYNHPNFPGQIVDNVLKDLEDKCLAEYLNGTWK